MPNKFRVFDQQIYAGGEPSAKDMNYFKKILNLRSVLSLDAAAGARVAPLAQELKIQHFIVPLNPNPSVIEDSLRYLSRQIKNILSNNQPIYVHCLQGQDRVGIVLALWRVLHDGWKCQSALNEARKWGYGLGISPQTQKLWETFLCSLQVDSNAVLDNNFLPPAFEPQQSWAPYTDSLHQDYIPPSERQQHSENRQVFWQALLENQGILVGQNAGSGLLPGAGPVENSGIMQYSG